MNDSLFNDHSQERWTKERASDTHRERERETASHPFICKNCHYAMELRIWNRFLPVKKSSSYAKQVHTHTKKNRYWINGDCFFFIFTYELNSTIYWANAEPKCALLLLFVSVGFGSKTRTQSRPESITNVHCAVGCANFFCFRRCSIAAGAVASNARDDLQHDEYALTSYTKSIALNILRCRIFLMGYKKKRSRFSSLFCRIQSIRANGNKLQQTIQIERRIEKKIT